MTPDERKRVEEIRQTDICKECDVQFLLTLLDKAEQQAEFWKRECQEARKDDAPWRDWIGYE